MLPLHRTFKGIVFILFSLFLISCSNHSKQDIEIINALNESIEISNRFLASSSQGALMSLESKLNDPGLSESAKRWYPKAEKVSNISQDVINLIQGLILKIKNRSDYKISREDSKALYEKLMNYRIEILQVDSSITKQFKNSILTFTSSFDSTGEDYNQLYKIYFHDLSTGETIVILNKLKNNILYNQERLSNFCNEQMCVLDFWYLTSPIIMQNSKVVKPGDSIEITAGVLASERYFNPKVFVDNNQIGIKLDGFATYKLQAPIKSGKYYIPVRIDYINDDKKHSTFQKEIEYTVANIQKQ